MYLHIIVDLTKAAIHDRAAAFALPIFLSFLSLTIPATARQTRATGRSWPVTRHCLHAYGDIGIAD